MKFSPFYWVFSSVVILAGVGLMGTAAAMEYKGRDEEGESIIETFESVDNLKVEVSSCSLVLKSSENAKECSVEFVNAPTNPKMYMDGNTLHIEQKQKGTFRLISFGNWQKSGKLIITVPEQKLDEVAISLGFTNGNEISALSCKKLQLDCGVGDMTMDQIQISKELDLDGGTGDLFLYDVTVDGKCDMDLGVGEIEADGFTVAKETNIDLGTGDCFIQNAVMGMTDMDCGVGDIQMISVQFLGDTEIRQGTGDIKLDIAGSSDDYSVKTEDGTGDVKIDGENINTLKNMDAKYSINIKCGVGDVDICFVDEN